jgi:hypothetical protein
MNETQRRRLDQLKEDVRLHMPRAEFEEHLLSSGRLVVIAVEKDTNGREVERRVYTIGPRGAVR